MKRPIFFFLILLQLFVLKSITAQEILYSDTTYMESYDGENQRVGFGIGFKASTFGPGGEIIVAITPAVHVRLGGSYFKYSIPESFSFSNDINSDNYLILGGVSLLGNYHFGRVFFVSAGAIYNMIEGEIDGAPANSFTIGAINATPDQVGTLTYHVEPGLKVCPYVGFGLGRSLAKKGIFSFAIEAGAVYHGNPDVTLGATGMLTPTGSEEQEQTLEKNLTDFVIYPMVSLQLSIRIL
jgi:hypothetical protein